MKVCDSDEIISMGSQPTLLKAKAILPAVSPELVSAALSALSADVLVAVMEIAPLVLISASMTELETVPVVAFVTIIPPMAVDTPLPVKLPPDELTAAFICASSSVLALASTMTAPPAVTSVFFSSAETLDRKSLLENAKPIDRDLDVVKFPRLCSASVSFCQSPLSRKSVLLRST